MRYMLSIDLDSNILCFKETGFTVKLKPTTAEVIYIFITADAESISKRYLLLKLYGKTGVNSNKSTDYIRGVIYVCNKTLLPLKLKIVAIGWDSYKLIRTDTMRHKMTFAIQAALMHLYLCINNEGAVINSGSVLAEGIILPYMTTTWNKLVDNGYVMKYTDKHDNTRIAVTESGKAYINGLTNKLVDKLKAEVAYRQSTSPFYGEEDA